MAKKKVGKQRKDKFYQLAKETGYRSRAAFKLIQLNRKYEFLAKSRVLVDLCAAPGGWMQVASQYMPVSSLIIGIDLFPIKPIPRTVTIQADITTEACRQKLRKELQTWKADVVLHDGAPNVGRNWIHDAFKQNELVLASLKLASEVLNRGGWFVTKAFRSRDYTKLLGVVQKLFDKVHATKPKASRAESAEIFVVCQGFIGADKVRPEFLDPKIVFREETGTSDATKPKIDLQRPEGKKGKKPKAEGYPESQPYVLYNRLPISKFLSPSGGFLDALAAANAFHFDDDPDVASHPLTTEEIREYCSDLKVLGRGELRTLLNWRKKLLAERGKAEADKKSAEAAETAEEKDPEEDEEAKLMREIATLKDEERREAKRRLKKIRKQKRDYQRKLDAKMVLSKEEAAWETEVDAELFQIKMLRRQKDVESLANLDMEKAAEHLKASSYANDEEDGEGMDDGRGTRIDDEEESSEDEEDDGVPKMPRNRVTVEKNQLHDRYLEDIHRSSDEDDDEDDDSDDDDDGEEDDEGDEKNGEVLKKSVLRSAEDDVDEDDSGSEEDDEEQEEEGNRILVDLESGTKEEKRKRKAEAWFSRDVFRDSWTMPDELVEGPEAEQPKAKKSKTEKCSGAGADKATVEKQGFEVVPIQKIPGRTSDDEDDDDAEDENGNKDDKPKKEKKKKIPKLDAVGLAIGSEMIRSAKTKRDLMDESWNRHCFNETDGLPEWFVRDEQKHCRKPVPVSRETVKEYEAKLKPIDARPIKKVVEAKARKKKRAKQRMDKARKKAESVTDNLDMTEKEKSSAIKQIYRKAVKDVNKKKEVKYVVARKFQAGKKGNRPSGSKRGPYKVVDPRMKKDNRAAKKVERRQWNRAKKRQRR